MTGFAGVEEVAAAVGRGDVVAIPTDTVYGLACDPVQAAAVEALYAMKRRPAGLELGLLAADLQQILPLAVMGSEALSLARAFWPGPLSLIVALREPRKLAVPRDGSTISVRIPDHDLLRALLRRTGPLASTSANRHGDPPCTGAGEVARRLGGEVAAILDGGPAPGQPSTIIDLTLTPPHLLRPGPLSAEQLRPHLGGRLWEP